MKTIRARYIIGSRAAMRPAATGVEMVYRLMATSCPGLTVVNENREVVGVVTEFDLLGAMREGMELNNISAEKVMSKNPRTADIDTSAAEFIEIMLENNFTIVPIVRKKKFVGIVSRHEIMDAYVDPNFYRYIEDEKMKQLLAILLCSALLPLPAVAGEVNLHGFLQGNYSADTAASNPDGGDFKLAEERIQLKFEAMKGLFRLFVKTDAYYDHVGEEPELELREGYIDCVASSWDMRAGRQILTWGLGDLIFINDVFPKDYEAFFSGKPLEYLKKGADGVKIGAYPGVASFEFVIIPIFEPNNFPDKNRFSMFDPMPSLQNRGREEPEETFENTEIAVRAYRDIAGFDGSLYFYRGFFRQPAPIPDNPMMPTALTFIYPKLSVYGASLQGRALKGVLSLEAGYYDSREDRHGSDPMMPNSQTRFLLGYQKQLWEDFTVGVQYYAEHMHDYSAYKRNLPEGLPREKKLHDLVSIRLTQFLSHQTLRLSWFSFWSPSDGDYLLNPEVKYNFSDHIWAAVGANIFGGGEAWSQFGQLDSNDNVYVQLRYEF